MCQFITMGCCFSFSFILLNLFHLNAEIIEDNSESIFLDFKNNPFFEDIHSQSDNKRFAMKFSSIKCDKIFLYLDQCLYKKGYFNCLIDSIQLNLDNYSAALNDIKFIFLGTHSSYQFEAKEVEYTKQSNKYIVKKANLLNGSLFFTADQVIYDGDFVDFSNVEIVNNFLLPYKYFGNWYYNVQSRQLRIDNSKVSIFKLEFFLPVMYFHRGEFKSLVFPSFYSGFKIDKCAYLGPKLHFFKKDFDIILNFYVSLNSSFYENYAAKFLLRLFEFNFDYSVFLGKNFIIKDEFIDIKSDFQYFKAYCLLFKDNEKFFPIFNDTQRNVKQSLDMYKLKQSKSLNIKDIYYVKIFNMLGIQANEDDKFYKLFFDYKGIYFEIFNRDNEIIFSNYKNLLFNLFDYSFLSLYFQVFLRTDKKESQETSIFKLNQSHVDFTYSDFKKKMQETVTLDNLINYCENLDFDLNLHVNNILKLALIVKYGSQNTMVVKSFGATFSTTFATISLFFKDIISKDTRLCLNYNSDNFKLEWEFIDFDYNFQFGIDWKFYFRSIPFTISAFACYDDSEKTVHLKSFFKLALNVITGYYSISVGYSHLTQPKSLWPNNFSIIPAGDMHVILYDFSRLSEQLSDFNRSISAYKVQIANFQ